MSFLDGSNLYICIVLTLWMAIDLWLRRPEGPRAARLDALDSAIKLAELRAENSRVNP